MLHKKAWGCSSPSSRPWAHKWRTTNVCDTWPVRRQTYGYLSSRKASPPVGWYQIILLGDRGTCVNNLWVALDNGAAGNSNPRPIDHKSSTLPLHHRATYMKAMHGIKCLLFYINCLLSYHYQCSGCSVLHCLISTLYLLQISPRHQMHRERAYWFQQEERNTATFLLACVVCI